MERLKFIQESNFYKKYGYHTHWLSGVTRVYPITGYEDKEIVIQIDRSAGSHNRRRAYLRLINQFNEKFEEQRIEEAYYWRSDGSCPDTLTFYLRNPKFGTELEKEDSV